MNRRTLALVLFILGVVLIALGMLRMERSAPPPPELLAALERPPPA